MTGRARIGAAGVAALLLAVSAAPSAGPTCTGVELPFRLRVIHYDAALDAILVSGEFENALDRPLVALAGTLVLRSTEAV